MSERPPKAPESLSLLEQRQEIEQALAAGDTERAKVTALHMAERKVLGPWEEAILGRTALAVNDFVEANERLTKAHKVLVDEGAVLVDLASAKAGLKHWKVAAEVLGKAILQRPDIPELQERHGIYFANAGDSNASIAALKRTLALEPKRSSAWCLLGERHLERGDTLAGERAFLSALDYKSDDSNALWNLALLKEKAGDLPAALELLNRVHEKTTQTAEALHRRGQMLLSLGQLEEGWVDYAARLKNLSYVSWQYALRVPYWSGENLTGKRLVVWADQGLGEQLLTASLLHDAAARCGSLTFACDPRLVELVARSFSGIQVVPLTALKDRGPTLGDIDAQATLSELGAVLRPNLDAFPSPAAFLKADASQVKAFRETLKTDSQPLIGISWRSENALAGAEKSTSLKDHWSVVLQTPNVRFVSLQYGEVADEIAKASAAHDIEIVTVPDLDPTQDVDRFAALVAGMDAVISTSNTTVHVAGGSGVPAWAIVPQAYGRPWYWFDKGETSPWYRNLALVRSGGDWAAALAGACVAVQARIG